MKFLMVLLLSIFSSEILIGQESHYLVLKDNEKQTEQYFEGNQSIKVWTGEDNKHEGQLTILNDSLIQVGTDEIKLSEITMFKSATKNRKIMGGILGFGPPIGTGLVVGIAVISWGEFDISHAIMLALGATATAIFSPIGAAIGLSKKKAIAEDGYSLSIVKG